MSSKGYNKWAYKEWCRQFVNEEIQSARRDQLTTLFDRMISRADKLLELLKPKEETNKGGS